MAEQDKLKPVLKLGLAGPAIWNKTKKNPIPEGQDFTEPGNGADVSPATLDAASDYADSVLRTGRSSDGAGNGYYPDDTNTIAASHKVGDAVTTASPGAEGKIFADASEMTDSPGVGNNFFESATDLIDKTGGDASKNAEALYATAGKELNDATVGRLVDSNVYAPTEGGEYTDLNPGTDQDNEYVDVLYTSVASTPLGEFNPGNGVTLSDAMFGAATDGLAEDLLGDPRQGTNSNKYKPGSTESFFESNKVGDAVTTADPGEKGNIFATATELTDSPGVGPEFFKSATEGQQLSDLIDKTGAEDDKDAKSLYAKAEKKGGGGFASVDGDLTKAVQEQLESNQNDPDSQHVNKASLDFVPYDVDSKSNVGEDVDFPGAQNDPGFYKKTDEIPVEIVAQPGLSLPRKNPNKPPNLINFNDSATTPKSAGPAFTDPGDEAYAQKDQLAKTLGAGPNFFGGDLDDVKELVKSATSPLELNNSDEYQGKVYEKLAGKNYDDPDAAYIPGAKPDKALEFGFPKLTDEVAPGNNDPGMTLEKGEFGEAIDDAGRLPPKVLVTVAQAKRKDKNEYYPNPTIVVPTEKTANKQSKPNPELDKWFVSDQDRNLDGTDGKYQTEGVISSLEGFRFGQSTLISETGPKANNDPSAPVLKVPKPGEPVSDAYAKSAAAGTDPKGVISSVIDMLEANNLYHPTENSPFFKGGSTNEGDATQGLFTIQRELGKFVAKITEDGTIAADGSATARVTANDMKLISQALLVRATGDYAGSFGLLSDDSGDKVLQNPLEQLGLRGVRVSKLDIRSMERGDVPKDLQDKILAATGGKGFIQLESGDGSELPFRGNAGTPYNSISHGQLNNYLEPFGNGVLLDSVGMLYLAVLAIASILVTGLVIEAIAAATGEPKLDDIDADNPQNLEFGRHRKGTGGAKSAIIDFLIEDFLRIPRTSYGFGDSLGSGIVAMIGFPPGMGRRDTELTLASGQGLVEFALNLFTSPAYYANYMRTIIMSGQQVIGSFGQLTQGTASQGLEKFFSSLNKLVNSKVYQFLMISATVGDAILKSQFGSVPGEQALFNTRLNESPVSAKIGPLPDEDLAPIAYDVVNKLRAIAKVRKNISRWIDGDHKNPLSLSTFPASQVADTRLTKLAPRRQLVASKENVRRMEDILEAEYMPFYFHDLRTHEIVSMPAFVTSFDDSYTANYTSVNSYGRQDPVRIYNSTERTVNLTFKLVAFGKSDFDAMWYTINKFVTMMYPQYSKGLTRTVKQDGKDVQFIQPFSQVPAASPLIRIRLGDLYKSNYSNTALRNLFGYSADSENFKADQSTSKQLLEYPSKVAAEIKKEVERLKEEQGLDKKAKNVGDRLLTMKLESAKTFKNKNAIIEVPAGTTIRILDLLENTPAGDKVVLEAQGIKDKFGAKLELRDKNGKLASYKIKVSPTDKDFVPKDDGTPGEIVAIDIKEFTEPDLTPEGHGYEGEVNKKAKEIAGEKQNTADQKLADDFFSSDKNAIVRSFESTQGKGLAGFITSLGFDYADSTWSIDEGSRAPKSVTITMAFAPIHDLPVGLDSDGRMRAMSHPVGNLAKNGAQQTTFGDVYETDREVNDNNYTGKEGILPKLAKARTGANQKKGLGGGVDF